MNGATIADTNDAISQLKLHSDIKSTIGQFDVAVKSGNVANFKIAQTSVSEQNKALQSALDQAAKLAGSAAQTNDIRAAQSDLKRLMQ